MFPVIDEDDLADILVHINPLREKCYKIGTALRLKLSKLEAIKNETPHPSDALPRIINCWLVKDYNWVRFGEPTWKALVEAIASPIGGDAPALAEEIAKSHPATGE